jgi:hypothetical protein
VWQVSQILLQGVGEQMKRLPYFTGFGWTMIFLCGVCVGIIIAIETLTLRGL